MGKVAHDALIKPCPCVLKIIEATRRRCEVNRQLKALAEEFKIRTQGILDRDIKTSRVKIERSWDAVRVTVTLGKMYAKK